MDWLIEHASSIGAWFSLFVATCTGVAGLTPTKKDDSIVALIVRFADLFSLVNTRADRAILKEAKEDK